MLRTAAILTSVICVAIVLTAAAAAGYAYATGLVDADTVRRMQAALSEPEEALPDDILVPEELAQVAKEEVIETRAMRILDLTARERELNLLKGLLESKSASLVETKQELERAQSSFKETLDAAEAELLSDAAEQARGILKALPPAEAVAKLMTLETDEAVRLMKGLPEKTHAKILQEFKTVEQTARGNEIFQAIVRGRPQVDLVREAAETTR